MINIRSMCRIHRYFCRAEDMLCTLRILLSLGFLTGSLAFGDASCRTVENYENCPLSTIENIVQNPIEPAPQLCQDIYQKHRSNKPVSKHEQLERTKTSNDYSIEEKYLTQATKEIAWEWKLRAAASIGLYAGTTIATSFLYMLVTRRMLVNEPPQEHAPVGLAKFMSPVLKLGMFVSHSYAFSSLLLPDLQSIKTWAERRLYEILGLSPKQEIWSPEKEVRAAKIKYETLKHKLPKNHQIEIEDIFTKLEKMGDPLSIKLVLMERENSGDRKTVLNYLKIIDGIMKIPHTVKKVEYSAERLTALLQHYPENAQNQMKRIAAGIAQASKLQEQEKAPRSHVYLLGASGTGKTYFARQFAQELGLPLIEIKLTGLKLEDLVGKERNPLEDNFGKIFKLSQAITSLPADQRYKNAIVFFDEVDKSLNEKFQDSGSIKTFLLDLLERHSGNLFLNDLNVNIDTSRFTFVFSGNSPLATQGNALMARMNLVNFGAFNEDQRLNIACKYIAEFKEAISPHDEVFEKISNLVKLDQRKNIGVRALLGTIDEYFNHRAQNSLDPNMSAYFDFNAALENQSQSVWDAHSVLANLQAIYKQRKNLFTSEQQLEIEKHFMDLEQGLINDIYDRQDQARITKLKNYFTNLEFMLRIPQGIKNLEQDAQNIHTRLEKVLSDYSPSVAAQIRDVVDLQITASTESDSEDGSRLRKNVVYLYGDAGVGKTHLAREIAKALAVPIIEFPLAGVSSENFSGRATYDFTEIIKFSKFSESLVQQNALIKNAVIFIDEAEKALNSREREAQTLKSLLLKLLDPEQRTWALKELGFEIDTSRFLFIIAGNKLIKDSELETEEDSKRSAINDRMHLVHVPGYNLNQKMAIINRRLNVLLGDLSLQIREKERQSLYAAVDYDHNVKKNKSLRPLLKMLELYGSHLKNLKKTSASQEKEYMFMETLDRLSAY